MFSFFFFKSHILYLRNKKTLKKKKSVTKHSNITK